MNLEQYSNLSLNKNKQLPGFYHALIIIALVGVISLITTSLIQIITKVAPWLNVWAIFISYTTSLWIVLVIVKKWWLVSHFDTKNVNIVVYLLLIPLVVAMSVVMESIISLIPMPEKIQKIFEQMVQLNLQGYLTIAIAAPIFEELIFRGIVLKKFLQKYTPKKAIVFSAIIFGIVHLNPWQFIAAFTIGIAIGWIYWKTQSVWPGIFIHFVNNSFSFYLAKKYESINITLHDIIGNNVYYISLIILCLLICYSIYLVLNKYFNTIQSKNIEII